MQSTQYHEEFLAFKDKLKSFVFRLTTHQQDTEDIIHDVYLKVFEKIETFKGGSSFKTWVFAIALNTTRNHISKQKRWLENSQDYGAALHLHSAERWDKFFEVFNTTPDRQYEIKEHINYCFNCITKTLELKQQICILLKEVYEFKVSEIMQITELSEGKVKHAVADARKNMNRIFEHRCALINKEGTCTQCSSLRGVLNPEQDEHIQLRKIKMCNSKSENLEALLDLRIELTRDIDPLNAPNSIINIYMLEQREVWVNEGIEKNVLNSRPKSVAHLSKV